MASNRRVLGALAILVLCVCTSPASDAPASADKGKPHIVVLATGGTIAGAQASQTQQGYKSGTFKVEDLIAAVPTMKDLADMSGEQIVNIGSQDMNDEVWLKLAKRLNEVLKDENVDGVVITHGTDTMEETAYFLDLVVKSDKPVVMVGSMRPATAVSADGPANLYNAVAVAVDPGASGRGTLIVMNDEIHGGRDIEKMNTTSLQTMASPERGAQGLVNTGKIVWFEPSMKKHTSASEFDVTEAATLPRVDILYAHANMSPDLITAAVKNGAKGIVIAGVGDGNFTTQALEAVKRAIAKGTVVVRSTRVGEGIVRRNIEVDDDKVGTVVSKELNPSKARVLLKLSLTQSSDPKKVQEFFDKY